MVHHAHLAIESCTARAGTKFHAGAREVSRTLDTTFCPCEQLPVSTTLRQCSTTTACPTTSTIVGGVACAAKYHAYCGSKLTFNTQYFQWRPDKQAVDLDMVCLRGARDSSLRLPCKRHGQRGDIKKVFRLWNGFRLLDCILNSRHGVVCGLDVS